MEKIDKWDQGKFLLAARSLSVFRPLLSELESLRGNGRNDYPVAEMWEYIELMIAGRLPSIRSLQQAVKKKLPSPFSFSRFLGSVAALSDQMDRLLFQIAGPGEIGAIGAIIQSNKRFTFLWDAETGLPFLWEEGSASDPPSFSLRRLLSKIQLGRLRFLIGGCEYEAMTQEIWETWHIRPIIPLASPNKEKKAYGDAVYNEKGEVFCPGASMVFGGFEEKRQSLKFLCPAKHYGYVCADLKRCSLVKNIRIPLGTDSRVFTPLPRCSYRWQNLWSMYGRKETIEQILLSRIPRAGKQGVFLRVASLLFAAAHRTKKLSKRL